MAKPKINGLTHKQREVLAYLHGGVHPTEIAKKLGISRNGVYQHMRRIREAGLAYPTPKNLAGRPKSAAKAGPKKPVGRPKGSGKKPVGRPKGSGHPVLHVVDPVTSSPGSESSIEDSIKAELETCLNRVTDIEGALEVLNEEKETLFSRVKKLKVASEALAS
jgi:hypothetical protein